MKRQKLNPANALSKDELRKIKGGSPICNAGVIIACHCGDGTIICDFGDGVRASAVICMADNACVNHGGYAASGCAPSCPGA